MRVGVVRRRYTIQVLTWRREGQELQHQPLQLRCGKLNSTNLHFLMLLLEANLPDQMIDDPANARFIILQHIMHHKRNCFQDQKKKKLRFSE